MAFDLGAPCVGKCPFTRREGKIEPLNANDTDIGHCAPICTGNCIMPRSCLSSR